MTFLRRRFNRRERVALYLAQDGKCARCGIELTESWHGDHIEPWSHGGPTDVINGQALCPTCNLKKGSNMENKRPLRKWQQEALELYDQHQGFSFLVEACPAAGKTRFMAEVVFREHAKGKADAFVIVVPGTSLRYQMALDFHDETGIQLNPDWDGMTPLVHGQFKGAVVNYQWIAAPGNALLLRRAIARQNSLVVLDEVHHAEEESAWGKTAHEAFDHAQRILLATGTPFRSNGNPIPWVEYDKRGIAVPNYSYNYGKAIREPGGNVVRQLNFNRHEGAMVWMNEDGKQEATFADKVSKRGESERLRTALMSDGEVVGALLAGGMKKLSELRKDDPDAAMLVITMNQDHAIDIAKRIRNEYGINPIMPISKDTDAADKIRSFKHSEEPCIVAVRMVSEGVNIPRIRVIVYLTNIISKMFFIQAMGRAMRTEPGHDDPTAWVYIPDDPRLRAFAQEMMDAADEALRDHTKRTRDEDGDSQPNLFYDAMRADAGEVSATKNGVDILAHELAYASSLKDSEAVKWIGYTPEDIAYMLKITGYDFTAHRHTYTSQQKEAPKSKAFFEELSEVRGRNNKIASRIAYVREVEFADVHKRLNIASGIGYSGVSQCADLDKLERRFKIALRWLKDGTVPEVPFND